MLLLPHPAAKNATHSSAPKVRRAAGQTLPGCLRASLGGCGRGSLIPDDGCTTASNILWRVEGLRLRRIMAFESLRAAKFHLTRLMAQGLADRGTCWVMQ